jgi:hypothetical protein
MDEEGFKIMKGGGFNGVMAGFNRVIRGQLLPL